MKAIIPVAGLGTRLLPITKSIPKEMLPIVDTPAVQIVVQEALDAGLREIILVQGRGKGAIEDHFDHAFELEQTLIKRGKGEVALEVDRVSRMVKLVSIRQKEALGVGHAILTARDLVGNHPFAVLFPDDLYQTPGRAPAIEQLAEAAHRYDRAAVAVTEVAPDQCRLYGIIKPGRRLDIEHVTVDDIIEKPTEDAPSRIAVVGRFVLPPNVWGLLSKTQPGIGGEIHLTDALRVLAQRGELVGVAIDGFRHDVGDRLGYLQAQLAYALARPELADGVRALCQAVIAPPVRSAPFSSLRHRKAGSCACDGYYDGGCPMCREDKREPNQHGVKTDTGHPVFHGCDCCHGVDWPVELCECGPYAMPCVPVVS